MYSKEQLGSRCAQSRVNKGEKMKLRDEWDQIRLCGRTLQAFDFNSRGNEKSFEGCEQISDMLWFMFSGDYFLEAGQELWSSC